MNDQRDNTPATPGGTPYTPARARALCQDLGLDHVRGPIDWLPEGTTVDEIGDLIDTVLDDHALMVHVLHVLNSSGQVTKAALLEAFETARRAG